MIALYREHPEFGEYSLYESTTGELKPLGIEEYEKARASGRYRVYEWDGNARRTRFPRRVYFQITRDCNLSCDYCFLKAGQRGDHLEREAILPLAEEFSRQGLMEVRLTGGEPTLHPHFQEIYGSFMNQGVYVSVATNGLWSRATAGFFSSLPHLWLIISIDGKRETHDHYRPGSYNAIISNIRNLRAANPAVRIRLNTVLTRRNLDDLEHLASLTADLEAESITLIPLRPQVRHTSILEDMPTAHQFQKAIETMVEMKKRYGIYFTTTIETRYKNEILPDKIFTKRSSCAAGREGTNLDFDSVRRKLLVYACAYSPAADLQFPMELREPFLAGEFEYTDPTAFQRIWEEEERWTLFRDPSYKNRECLTCDEYAARCTGSCPIQNVKFLENDRHEDLQESIKRQIHNTAEWYCYKNIFQEKDHGN